MNKKIKILSLAIVSVSLLRIFHPLEVKSAKFSMNDKIQREFRRIKSFRPDLSKVIVPFLSDNSDEPEFIECEELESKLREAIDSDNSNDLLNLFTKEDLHERKDLEITILYPKHSTPIKVPLLHYCALKGKTENFKSLLKLKYENVEERIKITDYSVGWDVISFAVAFAHEEIINILKNMAVEFQSNPGVWEAASLTYRNDFLKRLIELSTKDSQDCLLAALFGAIRSNNLEGIELVLPEVKELNDVQDVLGLTPIHVATNEELLECLKLLIQTGANINSAGPFECTPLHTASEKDSFDVVNLLIKNGADINAEEFHGYTPLHMAAKENNFDIAKLLIEKGTNIEASDNDDRTPLYIAAQKNSFEVAKLLIENNANVYARSFLIGETPFHVAAEKNSVEVAELLIENKSNLDEIIDYFERTPLHIAALKGSLEVFQLLVSRGMNVDAIDYFYKVPLQYAAFECTNSSASEKIVRLLIENNCNVNVKGPDDIPLIIQVIINGFTDIVRLLIDKGVDLNETYGFYRGSLYYAVEKGNIDLVLLLLKSGAGGLIDINDLIKLFSNISTEQVLEFIDLAELEDAATYDKLISYARLTGHAVGAK